MDNFLTNCRASNWLKSNGFNLKCTTQASGKKILTNEIKDNYLSKIAITIAENHIPKDLVVNFDETGLHLTPAGNRSFVQIGETQVQKHGFGIYHMS